MTNSRWFALKSKPTASAIAYGAFTSYQLPVISYQLSVISYQ
ncbi:hypothetical protein [Oscillatoria salina]|nr:hypothetical protein [Oscillatoria salina]